jgi:hypothetical protein
MKRTGALVMALLFLLALALAVTARTPGQGGLPPAARARVEQYLASRSQVGTAVAALVAPATKPWNLTGDPGTLVFGDSVNYQTDLGSAWDGLLPVPFPPKELWCVLLQQGGAEPGQQSYRVVLVGLHMDMYNADWLIHVLPGSASDPGVWGRLSQIGCNLGLDEMGPRPPGDSL